MGTYSMAGSFVGHFSNVMVLEPHAWTVQELLGLGVTFPGYSIKLAQTLYNVSQ